MCPISKLWMSSSHLARLCMYTKCFLGVLSLDIKHRQASAEGTQRYFIHSQCGFHGYADLVFMCRAVRNADVTVLPLVSRDWASSFGQFKFASLLVVQTKPSLCPAHSDLTRFHPLDVESDHWLLSPGCTWQVSFHCVLFVQIS